MGRLTDEASARFADIQRKVSELQDAIIAFGNVFETNCVGLEEWMDDMDETLHELAAEVYSDDE